MQDRAALHESIKTLVVAYGPREAARQAGLSENTVLSLARRKGWKQAGQIIQSSKGVKLPHSLAITSPADTLLKAANSHKSRSVLALGQWTAEAAEQALEGTERLGKAKRVRDVAAVHATIWPTEARQGILNVGILIGNEKVIDLPGSNANSAHESNSGPVIEA